MSSIVSIHEAQEHLTRLLSLAERSGERFIVKQNGKTLGAIVGIEDAKRIEQIPAEASGKSLSASQRKRVAARLGRRFTLPASKARRLRELVEKEDSKETLSAAEKRELRRLLKEHEDLVVKRAQALDDAK